MPRHTSTRVALAALAAGAFATPAAAQSLDGTAFTYEVLGAILPNTTGTATVGPGAEFTISATGVVWAVDVDATGVTVTPTFDNPGHFGVNWGVSGGTALGALRLSGFRSDDVTFGIAGFVLSGTAGAGDSDITTRVDSVQIGATSGPNNVLNWEPGEFLRLDLTIEPACPWAFNETAGTYHTSVADAIANTIPGDVLELGPCTFFERGLVLDNADITVRGAGQGETVVDGQGQQGRILEVRGGDTSVIQGVTFRNALADAGTGGATAVYIHGNGSDAVTFRDCAFTDHDSNGEIRSAVRLQQSSGRFERCRFLRNTSVNNAPGVDLSIIGTGRLEVVGSLFASSMNGGAQLYGQDTNHDTTGDEPMLEITNCTFGSFVPQHVLGGHHVRVWGDGTIATIRNSVFDNTVSAMGAVSGGSVSATTSVYSGATGDNTDALPVFINASNNDYRLASGSPGIDAADADVYADVGGSFLDLTGADRAVDDLRVPNTGTGTVAYLDAGAFENEGIGPTVECGADLAEPFGVLNVDDIDAFVASFLNGCL